MADQQEGGGDPANERISIALIAGATGLVGSYCLQALLQSEHYQRVISVVRRRGGISHPKLDERIVDFDNLTSALDGIKVDHTFCCLGTTMKNAQSKEAFYKVDHDYCLALGEAAKNAGASHFLLVSAIGASADSSIFYSRTKGETEEALEALDFTNFSVFRPSILVGKRREMRLAESIGIALAKATSLFWVGPLRPYHAIDASDVGNAMVADAVLTAQEPQPRGRRIYSYQAMQSLVQGRLPV